MGKQRADVKNESVTETVTDLKEEYFKIASLMRHYLIVKHNYWYSIE